jgi:hypothetical protein
VWASVERDSTLVEGAEEQSHKTKIHAVCTACLVDAPAARVLLQQAGWLIDHAVEAYARAQKQQVEQAAAAATSAIPEGDPSQLSREVSKSKTTVETWLRQVKLDRYADAIKEAGYDELQFLHDAEEEDIDEMAHEISMKKPHVRTFKKAWRLLLAAQEEESLAGMGHLTTAEHTTNATDELFTTGGHGNMHVDLSSVAPAPVVSGKDKMFGSCRFKDGRVLPEALHLQTQLSKVGVELILVDMTAGGDIDATVFSNIERADTFLVFGTADYGQDTGNPASTFYESKFAMNTGKRMILIRMIPYGQRYEQLQARQLFNVNKLCLQWISGTAMPGSLVGDIVKAVGDESTAPRAR